MPKIALVDDDRNILTSVSLTLEAEGYNVSTYTHGASCLECLPSDNPDPELKAIMPTPPRKRVG